MGEPVVAFIGLGANLGPAEETLETAFNAIAQLRATALTGRSALYRSAPIDAVGPEFVNAVARVTTSLSAPELLHALQAIEQAHGRERSARNAPRTLDLDLLLHGDVCSHDPALQLPHPRLQQRAFVLKPLSEIDPKLHIEGLGAVADLLKAVDGQCVDRLVTP